MIPFAASNPLGAVLGPLEDFIRETLTWIHDSSGLPWAWCIIVLTIMVRICLLPLTVKQTRSMQGMRPSPAADQGAAGEAQGRSPEARTRR